MIIVYPCKSFTKRQVILGGWNLIPSNQELTKLEVKSFKALWRGHSKWPLYPLVGGDLTFEGVTLPSQKDHKELLGNQKLLTKKDWNWKVPIYSSHGILLCKCHIEVGVCWHFPRSTDLGHSRGNLRFGTYSIQWLFLVPLKGGRWHIIPQLAVYTTYIALIYCLLGGYMLPTTL